ncbi:MAG: hypothetical protein HKP50_14265 [Myxococcales bacterium]|nr:hypothetical protein [Myxococcales bacterium]
MPVAHREGLRAQEHALLCHSAQRLLVEELAMADVLHAGIDRAMDGAWVV